MPIFIHLIIITFYLTGIGLIIPMNMSMLLLSSLFIVSFHLFLLSQYSYISSFCLFSLPHYGFGPAVFSWVYTTINFPILLFISKSILPRSSTIVPKYLYLSTCSIGFLPTWNICLCCLFAFISIFIFVCSLRHILRFCCKTISDSAINTMLFFKKIKLSWFFSST